MSIRRLFALTALGAAFFSLFLAGASFASAAEAPLKTAPLKLALFNVDATPPLESPLCFGLIAPAEKVVDRLSARGAVLIPQGQKPIVLCALDWVAISNATHDAWRAALADAAGTTIDRVSVHVLHPHDTPGCDFSAETLLAEQGLADRVYHLGHNRQTIRDVAAAIRKSLKDPQPVTHIGVGKAKVEKVASNRRPLGPDGKVKFVRYSSSREERARTEPEGVIDPFVRLIAFFAGHKPVASMTYYATHPQSYYGRGGVSADFVGMARAQREKETPGPAHIHFNGAGGNVAAGKYNDGSKPMRPILAGRLAKGMQAAWIAAQKNRQPIAADEIAWRTADVALPLRDTLDAEKLLARIKDKKASLKIRMRAARDLGWVLRCQQGHEITIGCLQLGKTYVVHMPGELFVEYQLAAQKIRPDAEVCMAAYGDLGPGYIGDHISYSQGGYETGIVSRTAPEVEQVLMDAMRTVLK